MVHALLALLSATAPLGAADLSPLLSDGAAAQGKAAFDAGRHAEAAEKLSRSPAPGAAYVRALALLRAGEHRDALQASEGLESKLPEIADRILQLRAQALEGLGRTEEALSTLAAVPEGSLRAEEARLARARLAASRGDRKGALAVLAPLLARRAPADLSKPDLAASALLTAGRLHLADGDPASARRAWLECWAAHPLAPEAAQCRDAVAGLAAPNGGPPSSDDVLRRAEALLEGNRNEAALTLLRPLFDALPATGPADPFACRVRAATGRGLRKEREYSRAIEALRPVANGCGDPEVRVRALYVLASASSIAGDRDEAVQLYRRLARDFPAHSFADDALFFAADLLARMGRTEEARDALATLVREHPTGDYRAEARFRLAWIARREGQSDAAAAQLLAIEEEQRGRDPYEHGRAAYWRARVLSAGGPAGAAAARAIWADLVARYPVGYYGLLARARLADAAEREPALPDSVTPDAGASPAEISWEPGPVLRQDSHFRAGVLLFRLGLPREAAEELGAIAPSAIAGPEVPPDAVLLVADLMDRSGDQRAAHGLLRTRARDAFHRPPGAENARAWRIAYPQAYREEVDRWAPGAGVPGHLVHALMREESALDPRALSPAGAIGLTQLMYPTAREVARKLKLGRISRASLTEASLNIRIGSRYLGDLVKQFGGSVPLALAAYNAGGGAVRRWLEQRRGLELDEFVEEIPVEETRGYVKRVLRSYAAYRLLYGGAEPASSSLLGLVGKG